jgi:anti-anti-sigma factor
MRVTQHHPRPQARTGHPRQPFGTETRTLRRGTLVRVTGEIDASTAPAVADVLAAAGRDSTAVLLDLDRTTFIDSAGIRVLVRSMWDLRDAGSHLRLVAVSAMAENILRVTGILDVLKDPAP